MLKYDLVAKITFVVCIANEDYLTHKLTRETRRTSLRCVQVIQSRVSSLPPFGRL
jgi:phage-related protein